MYSIWLKAVSSTSIFLFGKAVITQFILTGHDLPARYLNLNVNRRNGFELNLHHISMLNSSLIENMDIIIPQTIWQSENTNHTSERRNMLIYQTLIWYVS